MINKTERFELRLDTTILEKLDEWRVKQGDLTSRSEAVRRLIDLGLADKRKDFILDNPQKLMVWMLAELLKDPEKREADDKTINLIQKSIYGGHFWALDWEMTGVIHRHADQASDVTFVVDTLDMWRFIESAYDAFDEVDQAEVRKALDITQPPQFIGFDGNCEGTLVSIARFLVKELNRFTDLKTHDFNSHAPMTDRYQNMLARFEKIRPTLIGRNLSVAEVIELLKRG